MERKPRRQGKSSQKPGPPVQYARGRKGGMSVVDALINALNGKSDERIRLSFEELRTHASSTLGYDVPASTVRSTVYMHADLFEKCVLKDGKVAWRLSGKVKSV